MESTQRTASDHGGQREQLLRAELAERIASAVHHDGTIEPLSGLRLRRASAPTELGPGASFPSFCVIAQGSKELRLGDRHLRYDPEHYLIATTTLPIVSRVAEAAPERPYLGAVLRLDPVLVGAVLVEAGHLAPRRGPVVPAIDVSPLDVGLLDALVRLVRLRDSAGESRLLAPLVTREIVTRLLLGAQGARLHDIAALGSSTHRIAAAIERLRREFDQPLRIGEIAREAGMSVSGFHHHFRALTAMSPLQFQKQLRLQEARRLMLGEGLDAASAGFRVGYANASHFTREYKRLFGAPPMREVGRLRGVAVESAGL